LPSTELRRDAGRRCARRWGARLPSGLRRYARRLCARRLRGPRLPGGPLLTRYHVSLGPHRLHDSQRLSAAVYLFTAHLESIDLATVPLSIHVYQVGSSRLHAQRELRPRQVGAPCPALAVAAHACASLDQVATGQEGKGAGRVRNVDTVDLDHGPAQDRNLFGGQSRAGVQTIGLRHGAKMRAAHQARERSHPKQ